MIRFECDYAEGTHPLILERLQQTNFEQTKGYGEDMHCENARQLIRNACKNNLVDVHFMVGGTQVNTTIIASILKPYQGVLCAESGHINVHETGAIESTGHKVLTMSAVDGKISAKQVEQAVLNHRNDENYEHMVQPAMVYISYPTEVGTLYTKDELTAIHEVCTKYELPLYIDGARLGYGLSAATDMTLETITSLCDVFYIGGTKIGALFGEAVVIVAEGLKNNFRYMMKQRGGMLAKGRLLGIQYEVLFENGLYFQIAKNAVKQAMRICNAFTKKGFSFLCPSFTNQQFPILSKKQIEILSQKYAIEFWKKIDENLSAVRFCTSWATRSEDVDALIEDINLL